MQFVAWINIYKTYHFLQLPLYKILILNTDTSFTLIFYHISGVTLMGESNLELSVMENKMKQIALQLEIIECSS
jgi:hypothetical protein